MSVTKQNTRNNTKTYLALLRGINVGGNNKVVMADLKYLFLKSGFCNVQTYINSGNVVFSGDPDLIVNIETAFQNQFGFYVKFLFVEKETFQKIHNAVPPKWTNDKTYKTDVWFLWKNYARKSSLELLEINDGVDTVHYAHGAIIWHVPKKVYGRSGMNKVIGTDLYKNLTARNINTVRKLYQMMG